MMIAPVLLFEPSPSTKEPWGTVVAACPICGGLHRHGEGDGWRSPHCNEGNVSRGPRVRKWLEGRHSDYEIVGTEDARGRASRREAALPSPYRTNHELARQLLTHAIWSRVPLGVAAELIGQYVATSGEPQRVRSMSPAEFDAWLTSGHLDEIALRVGFVVPWWGRGNSRADFIHAAEFLRFYGFVPDHDPAKRAARAQIASTAGGNALYLKHFGVVQ
jgi:hypothetical protein